MIGFFYIIVTFFLWGSVYVAAGLIRGDLPPTLISDLRCIIAAIPLMIVVRTKYRDVKVAKEDWKYFIIIGFCGYFLSQYLVQIAISLTGSAMTSLLNSATPVAMMLTAAVILKEKITPMKIFCLFLALAGAFVITAGSGSDKEWRGILVNIISIFFWSTASVLIRKISGKYPAVMIPAYGMAISLILHVPAAVIAARQAEVLRFTPVTVLSLLHLGILCSCVAQYTWSAALSHFPASTCSLFYPLQPIFSVIQGYFLLDEKLGPAFFAGLFLISLDVILVTLDSARHAQKPAVDFTEND